MISKRIIKLRRKKKTNHSLAEAITLALKHKEWTDVAVLISRPTRKQSSINLEDIEKNTSTGDTVIIPGKILSTGELTKKVRICALGISDSAMEKLKKSKSEYCFIIDEIKKNPKAEGIKILA